MAGDEQSSENRRAYIEDTIWRSMLDAELNATYWGRLGRRNSWKDKWAKIFLAATSSSTVATWRFWNEIEIIWKILSGISALIAFSLPIWNWKENIQSISKLNGKWSQIQSDYEALWFDFHNNKDLDEIGEEYKRIKGKEGLDTASENLPHKKKSIEKCRRDILRSRGLDTDDEEDK